MFVFLGCSNEFKYANPPMVFDWNNIDASQVGKATRQIRINEKDICKNKTGTSKMLTGGSEGNKNDESSHPFPESRNPQKIYFLLFKFRSLNFLLHMLYC